MKLLTAAVALLALSACTPEQQAAVINDYANAMSAQAQPGRAPAWSVDASCEGAHIVLTGWDGVTDVAPSTGVPYAIVGLGSMNWGVDFDAQGNADITLPSGTSNPGWPWSLVINAGTNSVHAHGTADC